MYFLNDYYPYRKLVEVYYKKRDNLNVINTVEEFFKSGRFCNESQVLWFESKYKKACKYSGYSFSNFDGVDILQTERICFPLFFIISFSCQLPFFII